MKQFFYDSWDVIVTRLKCKSNIILNAKYGRNLKKSKSREIHIHPGGICEKKLKVKHT